MCENVSAHMRTHARTLKGALNEGKKGPRATEEAATERQGSEENVSLKGGNVSFSALSLSGIYFTMGHSAADDALAYSDGANRVRAALGLAG